MKKTRVLSILIVGVVLLAAFASATSAAPSTYEFTVNNKTSKTLEVTLLGAQNYIISVPPLLKIHTEVKPGVYQYSFYDCGQLFIGTVNMNQDRELKITQCNASTGGSDSGGGGQAAELVDIVLNNKTYKILTVALVGVQNYSFELIPGKTFAEVYKGTYQMSFYDCGKLNISTVKITKDGFQAKIYNCGNVTDEGSTGGTISSGSPTTIGPDEIQFFVKNETYSSFDILFLSDLVYTYSVIPGKNKISIRPGDYQYSYYACGELWVGNIRITHKDQDIRISSCSSASGRPDTGQNIVFKVKNLTGGKFTMTIDGPQFYTLEVKGGVSTIFEVEKGFYTFQYFACGTTITGAIFLRDGVTLKTFDCPGD
jgi:hypothetical protein